jgi:Predicted Zn-dependent protease
MMYVDIYYVLLVIPAFLVALIAQMRVKSTFNRYNRERLYNGMTGAQAARRILDDNGLLRVRVERTAGKLNDHYSHRENTVWLSDATYNSSSVAAVGVAAHEAGHALQYAHEYGPIRIRTAILPVTNIGANLAWPAIIIGYLLGFGTLVYVGIALFSLAVIFQLITLPVEYNASRRAMAILENGNMMNDNELKGARKVLNAAAATYLAALAVSIANLLRIMLVFGRRRR